MLLSVSEYFSKNIRLLILLLIMVGLLGGTSLMTMPKAEDPQFKLPINVVEIIAPGLSPITLESKVVNPIEDALSMVENIKTIEAEIKQGSISFNIRFVYGTDTDKSYDDIVRAVNGVRSRFPDGIQDIIFLKVSPFTVNSVKYALSLADVNDWQTLDRVANRFREKLQSLQSVRRADVWALPRLVVSVDLDLNKLLQHKISAQEVVQIIGAQSNPNHAGYVDTANYRFNINLSGEYESFDAIQSTVIKKDSNGQVLLRDVASLQLVPYKVDSTAFLNGQPVVFVTAQMKMAENIYNFAAEVTAAVGEYKTTFPEVKVEKTFSQDEAVTERVSGFLYDLLYGLLLILFCLLFFMGPKQSFWVSLALPLTIFITLIVLNAMGFVLQQMTIAGLIVSLGLLVDNSLVVVEQFAKYKGKFKSNIEIVKRVLSEVALPLVAGTFTTVLAFLPLLMLQSDTGDFMRALPVSVTVALIASLVVALIILPALMSVFGVSRHSKFTLSHLLNGVADKYYKSVLSFCLKWPYLILLGFVALTAFGISLLPKVGVSLFPKAEKNIVIVKVETPQYSPLSYTQGVSLELSEELSQLKNVDDVIAMVGSTNPRIYYNHVSERGKANYAELMLLLDTYDADRVEALISEVRNRYDDYAKAKINVYEFQQGPVTDRPVTVRVLGEELAQISERSELIKEYLEKQPLVFDVKNISSSSGVSLNIHVDENIALNSNLDVPSVESEFRTLIDGSVAGQVSDKYGQAFQIVVRGDDLHVEQLENIYVKNASGSFVPVSTVASFTPEQLEPPFYHYQRSRMNRVSADVLPGGNVANITADLVTYLDSLDWTGGRSYKLGGEEEARKENFGGLSQILIIVVLTIFIILFLQFNSFAQPAVIISLLPIAFAGGIFGMFVMGVSFSMMAFIGLISLIGIMVNDAIIIVDGFNRGMKQAMAPIDAMVSSASSRFTPVILTSLTTIMGLLPLTLFGGDLWMPMGTVIITGLAFTTLASLIWVPVLTIKMAKKPKVNK